MRPIPIIIAVIVTTFLFFFVIQRDQLLNLASGPGAPPAENVTETQPATEEPAEKSNVVRVVAVASEARVIDSAVVVRGETEATRELNVMAETSGIVISDALVKGTLVTEGQLLCEIDPGTRNASLAEAKARLASAIASVPAAEAAVVQARAQLQEAQINDNAASRLSEDGFASETRVASAQAAVRAAEAGVSSALSGLEAAQATIESAEAGVAAAQKEIDRLKVFAPFAGLLETDSAEKGELLSVNSPNGAHCATVIQLDPVKLVGFVPETEVGRVTVGARAGARLADGNEVIGQVTFLSRAADETTRTFRVEITVANPELKIRDGQTAEIIIASDGKSAHLLPQSALTLNDEGTLGVRTVTEANQADFVAVSLLRDTIDGVWLAGLPETANVIIIGQEYVVPGVPVEASYQETNE